MAVNTNWKVGSIDHPYGKQKGARGRRQPRESGQLQHLFLSTGKLLVFHTGDNNPAEMAAT